MAKGGIIMDVTTAEEARIAENAGVCNMPFSPKISRIQILLVDFDGISSNTHSGNNRITNYSQTLSGLPKIVCIIESLDNKKYECIMERRVC